MLVVGTGAKKYFYYRFFGFSFFGSGDVQKANIFFIFRSFCLAFSFRATFRKRSFYVFFCSFSQLFRFGRRFKSEVFTCFFSAFSQFLFSFFVSGDVQKAKFLNFFSISLQLENFFATSACFFAVFFGLLVRYFGGRLLESVEF